MRDGCFMAKYGDFIDWDIRPLSYNSGSSTYDILYAEPRINFKWVNLFVDGCIPMSFKLDEFVPPVVEDYFSQVMIDVLDNDDKEKYGGRYKDDRPGVIWFSESRIF